MKYFSILAVAAMCLFAASSCSNSGSNDGSQGGKLSGAEADRAIAQYDSLVNEYEKAVNAVLGVNDPDYSETERLNNEIADVFAQLLEAELSEQQSQRYSLAIEKKDLADEKLETQRFTLIPVDPIGGEENLSKTLSKYGITYECIHDPYDNDQYLKNFSLREAMADNDLMIEAYEILKEEYLRFMMAPGISGLEKPKAWERLDRFEDAIMDGVTPGDYGDKTNPVGFIDTNEFLEGFTPEQIQRIKNFKEKFDKVEQEIRDKDMEHYWD